jgi:hypothetical protein
MTSFDRYDTHHYIKHIFRAGAGCRTHARLFSSSCNLPPGFCAARNFGVTSEEATFGRLAVKIQNILFARRKLRWYAAGKAAVAWLPRWTTAEHWTWETIKVFGPECEWSHVTLSPVRQWYLSGGYSGRKWNEKGLARAVFTERQRTRSRL